MRRSLLVEFAGPAGFTLLEVMIAVAVIALTLVTLIGAQSRSVSLATSSRFETMASLLARWKLTDLMQSGYEGLMNADGSFGELHPDFVWQLTVRELDRFDTGLHEGDDLLKQLDLVVALKEEPQMRYSVRTLVSRPPEPEEEAAGEEDEPGEAASESAGADATLSPQGAGGHAQP
ncbi:MAG: type IV pilus modification PilV family protein [Desulfobulbus sp.]|jgi:general secretion pathway protein I